MSKSQDIDEKLTYKIQTFGCKVNTYDTSLIQKNLSSYMKEIEPSRNETADVYILNSCAVTFEATKEASRWARKLKSKYPQSIVVLTGCAAQVDHKFLKEQGNIDLIIGNSHKSQMSQIIENKIKGSSTQFFHSNIFKKEDLEFGAGRHSSKTRAFLKIQDGCNSFCSFCVIPFARGKSRSIPIELLIEKIQEFHNQGIQEVVLTGVHIGDYKDQSQRLEDLVESALKKTSIPRLRLTSLEPPELSERLFELYQHPQLCPHFHMSIQSAHTRVLQDMKRKYTAKDVENSLKKIALKCSQAFVGMDVIVGFPGETQKDFEHTFKNLSEWPWTRIHVFPYSPRPMTRAARMSESLNRSQILERSRKLRDLSNQRWIEKAKDQVGQRHKVLPFKRLSENTTLGLSRGYWNIEFLSDRLWTQDIPYGKSPSQRNFPYEKSLSPQESYFSYGTELEIEVKDYIFESYSQGRLLAFSRT